MKLKQYQQIIPTVSLVKRASVATSPTTITPKAKEQHEVVKFILKYANIVWAYLKTLPSKWDSVIHCFLPSSLSSSLSLYVFISTFHQGWCQEFSDSDREADSPSKGAKIWLSRNCKFQDSPTQ